MHLVPRWLLQGQERWQLQALRLMQQVAQWLPQRQVHRWQLRASLWIPLVPQLLLPLHQLRVRH